MTPYELGKQAAFHEAGLVKTAGNPLFGALSGAALGGLGGGVMGAAKGEPLQGVAGGALAGGLMGAGRSALSNSLFRAAGLGWTGGPIPRLVNVLDYGASPLAVAAGLGGGALATSNTMHHHHGGPLAGAYNAVYDLFHR